MEVALRLEPGRRVRLTRRFRKTMRWSGSRAHIKEFGRCVGIVQGPTDYNNVQPGHPDYDESKVGPELDVRWLPSGLRYAYPPDALEPA